MHWDQTYEKLNTNFTLLEENAQAQRKMSPLELVFILLSIVIMIPYEMVTEARWMLILGSANLFFDLVFVLLLFRFIPQARKGTLSLFTVITDSLAALPGLLALVFLVWSQFTPEPFVLTDFLAAGGLALTVLRSTKLLRVLRLARLFRLLRNMKLLRFIALRSDSTSCEKTVGWLGFLVLSLLILINGLTTIWGPLAQMQDSADQKREAFVHNLEQYPPLDSQALLLMASDHDMASTLVYWERDGQRNWGGGFQWMDSRTATERLGQRFNGLNSTLVQTGEWELLLFEEALFNAQKTHNLLWITGIILAVFLFSVAATSIIGRTYTDFMNDYRKAILDSYKGIQSLFEVDPDKQCQDDRESFAYAMGLYTLDFLSMIRSLKTLQAALEEKDQEIQDLNQVIQDMESEIRSLEGSGGGSADTGEAGSTDTGIAGPTESGSRPEGERLAVLEADLKRAAGIIKGLCARNPGLKAKIEAAGGFRSFRLG